MYLRSCIDISEHLDMDIKSDSFTHSHCRLILECVIMQVVDTRRFERHIQRIGNDIANVCVFITRILLSCFCTEDVARMHLHAVGFLLDIFCSETQRAFETFYSNLPFIGRYDKYILNSVFKLLVVCTCYWSEVWDPFRYLPKSCSVHDAICVFGNIPYHNSYTLYEVSTEILNSLSVVINDMFQFIKMKDDCFSHAFTEVVDVQHIYTLSLNLIGVVCSLKSNYCISKIKHRTNQLIYLLYRQLPYERLDVLSNHLNYPISNNTCFYNVQLSEFTPIAYENSFINCK